MSASSCSSVRPRRRRVATASADRIVEHAIARGPLAPAQRPHPATRLGQVDQPEIEREGTDDAPRRRRDRARAAPRRAGRARAGRRRGGGRSSASGSVRPARTASGPACSEMTWPSRAPSSRTSTASGSRAPAVPIPSGSAATAADAAERLRRGTGLARSASESRPGRNLPGRNHSVGLYRVDRDDRRIRVLARPRRRMPARPRRARTAPSTSSSSCASCTRSPAWRRPPEPGTSCSRPSSTGPAMCSTPTSPRCTCSTAMERT